MSYRIVYWYLVDTADIIYFTDKSLETYIYT